MTSLAHQHDRPAGIESAAGGNPRFPCMEGMRAVAAVAVLVHHVAGFTGAVTGTAFGYIWAHLDVGVSIFFVLSGFLLYRPFAAAHLEGRPGPGLRRYAGRRFLRIFPAYWLALTAVFFLLRTVEHGGTEGLLRYYSLTHIYSRDHVLGGIVPAWSLATELSFYVFLPFYGVLLGHLSARFRRPLRAEVAGVVALWLTGHAVHGFLLATRGGPTPATLWLPAQLDLFALGIGLAVAHAAASGGARVTPLQAAGRRPALTWLLAVVPFWIAATQLGLPREFAEMPKLGEMGRELCYGAIAFLVIVPTVFGDQGRGWPRRLLRSRPMATAGLVSYGVFLWHFDLLRLLTREGANAWVPEARFAIVLALTLGAALLAATVSWTLVEAPLLGRRSRRTRRA